MVGQGSLELPLPCGIRALCNHALQALIPKQMVAVAVAALLCTPAAASAEPTRPGPLASAIAAFAASPPPPQSSRSRDSLKNGAIIGAVAGAAALGGFGLFLCHALDDTDGDLDCFPAVLAIAGVGAGIGLGAGVGIDALLVRRAGPAVRVRVRF